MTMRPIARAEMARSKPARIEARLHELGALMFARQYCASQGATLSMVMSKDRLEHIVRARHRLWTVLLDTLALSYPACAAIFEVDHTTVRAAVLKRRAELTSEVAA
jgi:chromosomal replication initiation ATPase DnaA